MGKKNEIEEIKEEVEEIKEDTGSDAEVINKDEYIAKLNDDLKIQKENFIEEYKNRPIKIETKEEK